MGRIITILLTLCSLCVFGQHEESSLRAGLVGYWKFEETSGTTAYDETNNSNDGTISGATINQTGKVNKCYSYDGINDYVNLNFSASYSQFSYSAWIYLSGYGESSNGRIINKNNEILFYVQGSPGFRLAVLVYFDGNIGQWVSPTNSILTDTWYHVVLTFDKSSASNNPQLYINGSTVTTTEILTPSGNEPVNSNNYYIGNTPATDRTFDGKIDELLIYNRELSALEAKLLYNNNTGLLYVQENFKNNKNYEKLISYVLDNVYLSWIVGAN